jgi:uncharacterized protein YcbK (DUF882 family)
MVLFMSIPIDRRLFLKASLLTTIAALFCPGKLLASFLEKKPLSGQLNLYNVHTDEKLNAAYRNPDGRYDKGALKELNWLLRCHYTDKQYPIDIKVLEFLDLVSNRLGYSDKIHIISGYRSPEYNNYLLKHGHAAAKGSLHMEGRALDISIPGIDVSALRRAALSLRLGGVGYYPRQNFIHIDSGAFRTW